MFYILCLFLAGLAALGLVYLKNSKYHVVVKGGKRNTTAPATGSDIGEFLKEQKHPYVLDVRSDERVARIGLRHSGSIIIMYIPFEMGQEDAFVMSIFADSRMRTAREEERPILIVSDGREYGARVAALLVDHKFNPSQICDNLDAVSADFVRMSIRP